MVYLVWGLIFSTPAALWLAYGIFTRLLGKTPRCHIIHFQIQMCIYVFNKDFITKYVVRMAEWDLLLFTIYCVQSCQFNLFTSRFVDSRHFLYSSRGMWFVVNTIYCSSSKCVNSNLVQFSYMIGMFQCGPFGWIPSFSLTLTLLSSFSEKSGHSYFLRYLRRALAAALSSMIQKYINVFFRSKLSTSRR